MAVDKMLGSADRAVTGTAQEVNATADRLVLEVVEAVEDGTSGVPESQRLIAWLGADFIPSVAPRFPQTPPDLEELQAVLDSMHGCSGPEAVELATRARSLVFRLL